MTHITRVFNPQTRSLTSVERRYAGQVGDAISTVMHFEYTELDFLSNYEPYIMFGVYDDDGNPLIYGPAPEDPSELMSIALENRVFFNGLEFSIPWEVTSRVKTARVDYQIFFVKAGVEFDGRNVAKLSPTEVVMSAMDSIALKPSITCDKRKPKCCPPFAPTGAEPNLLGWVNLWRDYGLVVPVTQSLIEPEFLDRFGVPYIPTEEDLVAHPPVVRLDFRTYNGTNDSYMDLDNVPVLKDGKLIYYQLPYGNTENTVPLLGGEIHDGKSIMYDADSGRFVEYDISGIYQFRGICSATDLNTMESTHRTLTGDTIRNGDVYSCTDDRPYKAAEDDTPELYRAGTNWVWTEEERFEPLTGDMDLSKYQLESSKIDSWDKLDVDPSEISEKFYPTASLVKRSLDLKVNQSQIVDSLTRDPHDVPNVVLLEAELGKKLDDAQIISGWSELDPSKTGQDIQIPSAVLVKKEVDRLDQQDSETDQRITDEVATLNARISDEVSTLNTRIDGEVADLNVKIDKKTDIDMAVPNWDPDVSYKLGGTVYYAGTIFISQADNNLGNVPIVEDEGSGEVSEYWSMVIGGGSSSGEPTTRKYLIGDGRHTVYAIEHNLGTRDLYIVARRRATGEIVYPDYIVRSIVRVDVIFAEPPATNEYTIVVSPAVRMAPATDMCKACSGTMWRWDHDLGYIPMISTVDSAGNIIVGDITHNSEHTTTIVTFTHAHTGWMVIR